MRITTNRSALSPTPTSSLGSLRNRPLHHYPRLRSVFPHQPIFARSLRYINPSSLISLHNPRTLTTSPSFRRSRPFTAADVNMDAYSFPIDKMRKLKDPSRTPLVLISCGSFSPITYLHLRMFEMCVDWVRDNTPYEVVGGYLSPVSDAYKKQGLALAHHRLEMCRLASSESNWIMVDSWEASKKEYTRTALVLDHFQHQINEVMGGVETSNGERKPAKISLLSGADLIQTMSEPGVWSPADLDHILGRYGGFIIERTGTDMEKALSNLSKFRSNIFPIPQLVTNDVSSTKVRNFLRKDMSIRYLIPETTLRYIDEHQLFKLPQSRPHSPKEEHAEDGPKVNGATKVT